MIPYVGAYTSEQAAKSTAANLSEAGYDKLGMVLASDVSGGATTAQPAASADDSESDDAPSAAVARGGSPSSDKVRQAVDGLIADGFLPSGNKMAATKKLMDGQSLVAVSPGFGFGEAASEILSEHGTLLETYASSDPAPLSDWFGWPVLSDKPPSDSLTRHDWSLSGSIGLGMLSSEGAPLSKMIGLKPLTAKQSGWSKSLGLPILSDNAAPLSSMLGLKTTASRPDIVLSNDPTPLSSLLGLSVLSRPKDD